MSVRRWPADQKARVFKVPCDGRHWGGCWAACRPWGVYFHFATFEAALAYATQAADL